LNVDEEEGVIKDVSFLGSGCAISKASTSLMTAFFFIYIQVNSYIITTKWINTVTRMTRILYFMEVSRLPIVIQNDLLIEFVIVRHELI
jgi:hypothetical protein